MQAERYMTSCAARYRRVEGLALLQRKAAGRHDANGMSSRGWWSQQIFIQLHQALGFRRPVVTLQDGVAAVASVGVADGGLAEQVPDRLCNGCPIERVD